MADAAAPEAPVVDAPVAPDAAVAPAEPEVVWDPSPRFNPLAAKPTPSSEAAAAEHPASEPPASEDPASKPAEAAKAEIPTDWKAKLEQGDPEFLAEFENHPKVKSFIAGRAGFLAQQQREADARAVKEAELDRDAEADPDRPLSQERLAKRQEQIKANQAAIGQLAGMQAAQEGVAEYLASLPEDARAEVAKLAPEGKPYGEPGDLKGGLRAYMADVVQGAVNAELAKARTTWEKDTLPGLRKEIQAELLGHEPSPDLGVGAATAGGKGGLTPEKYAQMSPKEMAVLRSTPAGRAQIDQLWAFS